MKKKVKTIAKVLIVFKHSILTGLCSKATTKLEKKKNYFQRYAGTSSTYAGWIRDPVQMMVQQVFGECWMCSNIQFWQDWIKKRQKKWK